MIKDAHVIPFEVFRHQFETVDVVWHGSDGWYLSLQMSDQHPEHGGYIYLCLCESSPEVVWFPLLSDAAVVLLFVRTHIKRIQKQYQQGTWPGLLPALLRCEHVFFHSNAFRVSAGELETMFPSNQSDAEEQCDANSQGT